MAGWIINGFQGVGGGIVVLVLGWLYARRQRRNAMKASEIDRRAAQGKSDRELVESIYSVLITADPTPLNPHPAPGLVDRLDAHIAADETTFSAIKTSLDQLGTKPTG